MLGDSFKGAVYIKPCILSSGRKNHRHPAVDMRDAWYWLTGDDGEVAVTSQPRKCEQRLIFQVNLVLELIASNFTPFKPCRCRNQASPA